jgi:hypothetical protein
MAETTEAIKRLENAIDNLNTYSYFDSNNKIKSSKKAKLAKNIKAAMSALKDAADLLESNPVTKGHKVRRPHSS